MDTDGSASLLSIGEFAQRTRLTHKALRIYQRAGLLQPARIERNGYRLYDSAQISTGRLIGLLRGAGLSLVEIASVVEDLGVGAEPAVQQLERLLADKERRHINQKLLIRHVQTTLRKGERSMFEIKTRHVPAYRVMSMQRRLHAPETESFVREAKAAFADHLNGTESTGPLMLIFHGPVTEEGDGPLEVVLACPDHIQPTKTIGVRTEPDHEEAYTTITKAQWAYPAILAAYDAVANSSEVTQHPGSRLSCREVYLAEPDEIEEHELICDVAYPLGNADEAD